MGINWTPSAAVQKAIIGSIVLAVAYLLKSHYSRATSEDLIWIIGPVACLVELFSDLDFVHEPGYGWVDFEHDVVIAPACAGVNFYIIAFCMSAFQLTHRIHPFFKTLTRILIAGFLSYIVTILANVMRILLSSYCYDIEFHSSWLTTDEVHRIVGTCIFYLLLFSYSRAISAWADRQAPDHRNDHARIPITRLLIYFVPLLWYLAFSLGVPLANQAFQVNPEMFVRHALHVVVVTVVLTLVCITSHYLIIRSRTMSPPPIL
ncbi:MAG: exosortase K [Desulfocapsaceae bacterium]